MNTQFKMIGLSPFGDAHRGPLQVAAFTQQPAHRVTVAQEKWLQIESLNCHKTRRLHNFNFPPPTVPGYIFFLVHTRISPPPKQGKLEPQSLSLSLKSDLPTRGKSFAKSELIFQFKSTFPLGLWLTTNRRRKKRKYF